MTDVFTLSKGSTRRPKCQLLVIENFYENPDEVRTYALSQEYETNQFHPGFRTVKKFVTDDHFKKFQMFLKPFHCKECKPSSRCNGSFQYNIGSDLSWIHSDSAVNIPAGYEAWAGIIYLTPDAPYSSGTGFFKFVDDSLEQKHALDKCQICLHSKNYFDGMHWKLVNNIGNIYNRLLLFNADQYHMSMDYFGSCKTDARLIQLFFLAMKFDGSEC